MDQSFQCNPIGTIQTPFKEKFGVPRQSLMVKEAKGVIQLNPDPEFSQAVFQLETFSHIWILFAFQNQGKPWRARIEPPRTESHKTVGVFASRSPHRPNPIGMSVVKLDRIDLQATGGIEIHVSGVDLLDGTPILDIKPYLPYADSIPEANFGWAKEQPKRYPVEFSSGSLAFLEEQKQFPRLQQLVEEMLSWDPRPRSQRESMPLESSESLGKIFRFRILRFDVEWQIQSHKLEVLKILPL